MSRLYTRQEGLIVRELEGEMVVLDADAERIHRLNRTASIIWRCCESGASPAEIAVALVNAFDVEEHVALRDVMEALDQLRSLGLIVERPPR